MVPLTQREIAWTLGVNPNSILRAIANRNMITLRGRERDSTHPLSDEKIRVTLKEVFGVQIGRRTVTKDRKELKIPSSKIGDFMYELA